MTYPLYTDVALRRDLPNHHLRKGDMVRLVERHAAPDGAEGYSIEVINALGNTVDVATVDASDLEPLTEKA